MKAVRFLPRLARLMPSQRAQISSSSAISASAGAALASTSSSTISPHQHQPLVQRPLQPLTPAPSSLPSSSSSTPSPLKSSFPCVDAHEARARKLQERPPKATSLFPCVDAHEARNERLQKRNKSSSGQPLQTSFPTRADREDPKGEEPNYVVREVSLAWISVDGYVSQALISTYASLFSPRHLLHRCTSPTTTLLHSH